MGAAGVTGPGAGSCLTRCPPGSATPPAAPYGEPRSVGSGELAAVIAAGLAVLLAMAALVLPTGRLLDRAGHRSAFLLGITGFGKPASTTG